ncbi:peptidase domain-containing ABC transporter [Sphingomonas aurantiaca]|uniref:peptidase domain-containing ABC transporter n=1 Tax=Sphingomonas aurantiaca TaxID=185949 RepID=UPI002FE37BAD
MIDSFLRRKVRSVRQAETTECGLASLSMVSSYHGLHIDLEVLRQRFPMSLRGTNLKRMTECAQALGFEAGALKVSLEDLPKLNLPAILHWNMSHYVVVERQRRGRLLVHDPSGRTCWMSLAEVSPHYSGIVLQMKPGAGFEPGRHKVSFNVAELWSSVQGIKTALTKAALLSVLVQAQLLLAPLFMQLVIDEAVPQNDSQLVTRLAVGFAMLACFNTLSILIRAHVVTRLGTTLKAAMSGQLARRLLGLPIDWFERRKVGDVLSRFQSLAPIEEFLAEGVLTAFIDGILAIATLAGMALYSITLAAVTSAALVMHLAIRLALLPRIRALELQSIAQRGDEQTALIESIRGIRILRLFNRENARHALWNSKLIKALKLEAATARATAWQNAARDGLLGLESVVVVLLSAQMLIAGSLTVGTVFAYVAYRMQFLEKTNRLIDQAVMIGMLRLHVDRLSDIAAASGGRDIQQSSAGAPVIRGSVTLDAISYRYDRADPMVLDEVNLHIEAGEHVAITGASGGGKSTMVQILAGLAYPTAGTMLVDGRPIDEIGVDAYREQIAVVLQDDHLFAGTILENVGMFSNVIDVDLVISSAKAASIHDDVMRMPMGYETLVGDMGSTLSGGQKQRIIIARALYRRPRILIMDEGTSHLDREKELAVNAAVSNAGMTRIVIAHRQETINAADRVLRLEGGRLHEVSSERPAACQRLAASPA